MPWLRQPLTITRRGAFLVAAIFGSAIAVAIVLASSTVTDLRQERDRALGAERSQRMDATKVTRRLARLEAPSSAELDRAFKVRLLRCLRSRRCVRVVRRVVVRARPLADLRHALEDRSSSRPSVGGRPSSPQRSTPAPPTRHPHHGPGGPQGGGGGPGAPSPPSSPPARPPISVQIPGAPPVCTSLVAINC